MSTGVTTVPEPATFNWDEVMTAQRTLDEAKIPSFHDCEAYRRVLDGLKETRRKKERAKLTLVQKNPVDLHQRLCDLDASMPSPEVICEIGERYEKLIALQNYSMQLQIGRDWDAAHKAKVAHDATTPDALRPGRVKVERTTEDKLALYEWLHRNMTLRMALAEADPDGDARLDCATYEEMGKRI